jgi:hypothetical protein
METRTALQFADGDYDFWLPMPRVVAIERETARLDRDGVKQPHSIFAIFHDIGSHLAKIGEESVLAGPSPALLSEAHAIIRHALIGGGTGLVNGESLPVGETVARDLVETYCYPARPAIFDLGLAWQILNAAIYGIAPGSKKKDAKASAPKRSTKAGSS